MRPRFLAVLTLALVSIGCSPSSSTTTLPSSNDTTTTTAGATTSSAATSTTLPAGTEELPPELRAEITRLIDVTEDIRGLTFVSAPTVTVLTPEELSGRVVAQVEEDYEDVDADEALYKLLALVPADFDLLATLISLYGEQVAGYYDGDTEELVVTTTEEAFSPMEQATIVHELTHALTDQVLGFNERYNELFDSELFDQGSALQALIEGDASLAELLYVQQLDPAAQQQFLEEAFSVDTTVFDQVPAFMQDSLTFPYDRGFTFVEGLYSNGGYVEVDAVYTSPPASTEQVISPDDYPGDMPVEVALEDPPLDGYEIAYGSTWGELGFRLIFDQILGGANQAVDGWGGDSYNVYFDGSNAVLVLLYQGDAETDASELADALNDYVQVGMNLSEPVPDGNGQTYTGDRYAYVSSSGGQMLFVAASDPGVGPVVRAWFPGF